MASKDLHILRCSQCDFTSRFDSALTMHRQLHHEHGEPTSIKTTEKCSSLPRTSMNLNSHLKPENNIKCPIGARTSSATKLFDKLKSRICRSKTAIVHKEEDLLKINDKPNTSGATSYLFGVTKKESSPMCNVPLNEEREVQSETYACHMCPFDADRITVLDRHLLNDHKIGLEKLLKLVMAKTTDGLEDDAMAKYGIRTPYYKECDEIIEQGDYIIENVTPKVKILKHSSTNTDLMIDPKPDFKNKCSAFTKELELFVKNPIRDDDKNELMNKIETLNDCMCKFIDSSNILKKMLQKDYTKRSYNSEKFDSESLDLGLGDQDTLEEWEPVRDQNETNRKSFGDFAR